MRGALVAALLLTALLAGCTDETTSPATSSTTAQAANGTLASYSCAIQVGLSGNANLNNGTGGCIFTDGIPRAGTVETLQPAAGCTSWHDTTTGDMQTEGPAAVGTDYPEGTAFGVYCDASASPGATSTMSVLLEP